jgi:hypothetical protein
MNTISKEELKARLLKEGYTEQYGFEQTIDRLMNFDGKPKDMLKEWMETGIVLKFEAIQDIDIAFLRNKLKMKDPAIIIAYAMLLSDPQSNGMYLKRLAESRIIYHPSPDNKG